MNAPWICFRCGETKSPDRRVSIAFRDPQGLELGAVLPLCVFCSAMMRACLERGTGLTPIVARPKKKKAEPPPRVHACNVGPCSCGVLFTREEFEKHQTVVWSVKGPLFAKGTRR